MTLHANESTHPTEILCAPNTHSNALTGIPRVYEHAGAVWLELTGGYITPGDTHQVMALTVCAGLALLTLDGGAVAIMRMEDIDPSPLAALTR